MKKAAAFTVTVLTVFLCSCSTTTTPERICINRIFNSQTEIQHNSTAYTADFTSNENGCSAVFSSPERVRGFGIAINGREITYSLDSLTFTAKSTPEQTLPIEAICLAVSATPETATKNESGYTLCGKTKFGDYIMNIDAQTLAPTFIEYNEAGITVRFINQT